MQHGVPQSTPEQQQADGEEQKACPHIEPDDLPGSAALANWFSHYVAPLGARSPLMITASEAPASAAPAHR